MNFSSIFLDFLLRQSYLIYELELMFAYKERDMNVAARRVLGFVGILLGFFMALLDSTIVNISLPQMAKDLSASMSVISWVVNAYNLAFAVLILSAARIADQFGRRLVFTIGLALFTVASVLCGLSHLVTLLVLFRALQGLGGAILIPMSVPLVADLVPRESLGLVTGIWGAIAGLATACGPVLGGYLTTSLGWPSIFFVNLPLGIGGIVLCLTALRESRDESAGRRVDLWGIVAITAAMFCVVYALINASDWGWGSPSTLALFAGAVVGFVAFVVGELRCRAPMLSFSLFRITPIVGASAAYFSIGAGLMSSMFLLTFYLMRVLGLSSEQAGITIVTMSLASMVVSTVAGALSSRLGARWFATAGMLLFVASAVYFAHLGSETQRSYLYLGLGLAGIGLGCSMGPIVAASVRHSPPDKVGMVSGITQMTRALGGALGIAVVVSVLTSATARAMVSAHGNAHLALASSFHPAFIVVAVMYGVGVVFAWISDTPVRSAGRAHQTARMGA